MTRGGIADLRAEIGAARGARPRRRGGVVCNGWVEASEWGKKKWKLSNLHVESLGERASECGEPAYTIIIYFKYVSFFPFFNLCYHALLLVGEGEHNLFEPSTQTDMVTGKQ